MDNLNFKLPNKKEQTWFAHKHMEKYQVMIKQEKKVSRSLSKFLSVLLISFGAPNARLSFVCWWSCEEEFPKV